MTFRFVLLIAVVLAMPATGLCAGLAPGPEQTFPDLLADEPEEGTYGPDLLQEGPFISDPMRIMGDPLFEDDYTLSPPQLVVSDPLEPLNRAFFEFNDRLYFWVLKPVKTAYTEVVPLDFRQCFGNFFTNLTAPIHLMNNLLQGEFGDAGVVIERFLINSTIGIFGLTDPAADAFGIRKRDADLGQTLGKWGVDGGIYIFWPGIGPSNLRDSVGLFCDFSIHPVYYLSENLLFEFGYMTVERINALSVGPEVYDELKRMSLDPYVAMRQAYFEYRQKIINEQ